ncbi:MAG: hypothetical protein LUE31_12130 [Lachnospiraceae bacterium]|nr:hypothetical protein [Lachnospiraceae bacterium]
MQCSDVSAQIRRLSAASRSCRAVIALMIATEIPGATFSTQTLAQLVCRITGMK